MTKLIDVLAMLLPDGGYVVTDNDINTIIYDVGIKPLTNEQIQEGFVKYDSWKSAIDLEAETKKQALLEKLGLTIDDLKVLGLG